MLVMSILTNVNILFVRRINFSVRKLNNAYQRLGFVIIIWTVPTNQMKWKIVVNVLSFCVTIRSVYHIRSCVMVWIIAGKSYFIVTLRPYAIITNLFNTNSDNSDENQCTHQCRDGEVFCHPKGCININDQFCDGIGIYFWCNHFYILIAVNIYCSRLFRCTR